MINSDTFEIVVSFFNAFKNNLKIQIDSTKIIIKLIQTSIIYKMSINIKYNN